MSAARSPRWARLCLVTGLILVVASAAGLVGGRWIINTATAAVTQSDLLGGTRTATGSGSSGKRKGLEGPINLLLLGVDARKRWAVDDLHADTIIVLHIPASHDRAYLMSVPRDTEVDVPAFGRSRYPGGTAKATEAFFHGAQNGGGWTGGAQLLAQSLRLATGMSFDGAAIIDFNGFKGVIDALGGVRMCVDQRVRSHHLVLVGGKPLYLADARRTGRAMHTIWYERGCRTMEGWQALDYARQRYGLTNGDYDRQRHQQQLLKAMAKKATSAGVLTNLGRVNRLIKAAGQAFVLDTGGVPIADFLFTVRGIGGGDLVLLRTNDGSFATAGDGRERLTLKSRQMFRAAQLDRLGAFVSANPAVVARS